MKLMIVEDEAIAALFLRSTLERLGYAVTSVVDNGEQAVQQAADERPDVVLMDIRLRGSMDGVEAASRTLVEPSRQKIRGLISKLFDKILIANSNFRIRVVSCSCNSS